MQWLNKRTAYKTENKCNFVLQGRRHYTHRYAKCKSDRVLRCAAAKLYIYILLVLGSFDTWRKVYTDNDWTRIVPDGLCCLKQMPKDVQRWVLFAEYLFFHFQFSVYFLDGNFCTLLWCFVFLLWLVGVIWNAYCSRSLYKIADWFSGASDSVLSALCTQAYCNFQPTRDLSIKCLTAVRTDYGRKKEDEVVDDHVDDDVISISHTRRDTVHSKLSLSEARNTIKINTHIDPS